MKSGWTGGNCILLPRISRKSLLLVHECPNCFLFGALFGNVFLFSCQQSTFGLWRLFLNFFSLANSNSCRLGVVYIWIFSGFMTHRVDSFFLLSWAWERVTLISHSGSEYLSLFWDSRMNRSRFCIRCYSTLLIILQFDDSIFAFSLFQFLCILKWFLMHIVWSFTIIVIMLCSRQFGFIYFRVARQGFSVT